MKTNLTTILKAQDASEITLNDLSSQVSAFAQSDTRFNSKIAGSNNSGPWVSDILTDGDNWKAVISAANGKTYEVGITVLAGKVTALDSQSQEVTRRTSYVKATLCFNGELVKAAGNSDGAGKGHAARKTALADKASQAAHEASAKAHETGTDADHEAAQVSHEIASEAHKKAMLAHAKAGDGEKAGYHATAMAAHDACADAHGGDDADTVTAALQKLGDVVKAGAPMGNQNAAGPHDYQSRLGDANKASELARSKSKIAKDANDDGEAHFQAATAHSDAAASHYEAAKEAKASGDTDREKEHLKIAKYHENKSFSHQSSSNSQLAKFVNTGKTTKASDETAATNFILATSHDIVHCRASGSKLRSDAAPEWKQDVPVEFCYMPGGLHTINAGFCGPITKGRAASINLTLDVDPDRDAAVCQASAEALKADAPKQDIYGCYEHDEKKASVWARNVANGIFKSGLDPVHQEPCILLAAEPSGDGAADVNKKNWRSWSPSFSTNAEYTKCKCSRCETGISVCACDKPQFYFPPNARGSAEKPAQITGIDSVLGTLTNKPAFRAMPPVRARQQDGTVKGADDLDTSKESESYQSKAKRAELKSKVAKETEKTYPEGENHGEKLNAHRNAEWAHQDAAAAATTAAVKQHHMDAAKEHNEAAQEHQKVVAKNGDSLTDLDAILARAVPLESLDTILAKYKQVGVRVIGYAAELAKADEILERINKK